MPVGLWVFVGWMAFVLFTGLIFLLWAWKTGQFKNVEEAKYRMLEDREPQPWPDKKGGNAPDQPVTKQEETA